MVYKALRFDARTARIDPETLLVVGPHEVLKSSQSNVVIFCDTQWEHSSKHSFFVVRQSERRDGRIVSTDVSIMPPGHHFVERLSRLMGTPSNIDAEHRAFMLRLLGGKDHDASASGGALIARNAAEALAARRAGIPIDPVEGVGPDIVRQIVRSVIGICTNYRGRLRIHLADSPLSGVFDDGHVYFETTMEDVAPEPAAPPPDYAAHDLCVPLQQYFARLIDYDGRLWIAFPDTTPCEGCGRGFFVSMTLRDGPRSLNHHCDPVPEDALIPPGSLLVYTEPPLKPPTRPT